MKSLLKKDLIKIAEIEKISIEGTEDELVSRLARLNLKKIHTYVKKLSVSEAFDIFKHDLVPKHKIIDQKEREKLFEKYGITEKHLPRIRVSDTTIMAIGGKEGDIVEITRKNPFAGETKYYRVVIKEKRD